MFSRDLANSFRARTVKVSRYFKTIGKGHFGDAAAAPLAPVSIVDTHHLAYGEDEGRKELYT